MNSSVGSTNTHWPVGVHEASDSKNTLMRAISSGVVMRWPSGILRVMLASFSSGCSKLDIQRSYSGVITSAGITALTRTPDSSSAMTHSRVSDGCAPLAAQ